MRLREWVIWAGAGGLSLLIHLALFVDSGSVAGVEKPVAPSSTRISFRSVAAPVTPPQDAPQQEIKQPVEEVVEAPKPPPKPKTKKKKKRAEKVRQVEPPKPTPQPPAPAVPTTETAQKPALPAEAAAGSVDDPALLERAKHEYLRRLMAHIESHKNYPRVARRRGIEGDVAVKFRLLQGGEVGNVSIEQGHRVLRKAVKEAIAAAQPMPVPPPTLALPLELSFSVQFSLQ
jgi:protein TonB